MSDQLPKNYDPALIEGSLFERWLDAGYFERGSRGAGAACDAKSAPPYTIVIPPPNITGKLHMGHALNDTLQDTCIRRARMQGLNTRWVLGTDHAGIATQTKVDKKLADEGISRLEIGRERFIEACYDWRREYGTTIVEQIKTMGCSCDFADEHFTLDPDYIDAVRRLFVEWYHDGLIYRGKRIVNWCPSCTTAIADDEAEYVGETGHLWYLRYPLKEPIDGQEYIVVATTRPETMLGDTGVAVSPKDEEKRKFVGASVILPLVSREIPIFSDYYVDAGFGTGFVKVTPAHDPNDYGMGERHGLERINIFDETAHVVEGYGKFSGMSRDEARDAVVKAFDEAGLLDHVEEHEHSVMTCYRCHTKLEPWLSEQWFVAVERLKELAGRVVEDGSIKFHPSRWKQVYLDWLANLKDWCISRQLWWGHRIPMFYCDSCGWEDASVEEVKTCPKCGAQVRQDDDVLDTWFSSQLWPFATLGWTREGQDAPGVRQFYPTQVLSTARDIMGLWVARMVMAGMYCCNDIPFENVIIHPTVMGADGKPMSKSRGNGVDPIELIDKYGADAMRFGLALQVTGSQDIRFNEDRLKNSAAFATKIWNAARFVLMNLEGFEPGEPKLKTAADRWMFSRLAKLVAAYDAALDEFDFGEATRFVYDFFWSEFCDWYIEFSKPRLQGEGEERRVVQNNLVFVLDQALRLLHPIMPFVTSEIWSRLPHGCDAPDLMVAPWPSAAGLASYIDEAAEVQVRAVCEVIGAVRSIRARYSISSKADIAVTIRCGEEVRFSLEPMTKLVCGLAHISKPLLVETSQREPGMVAALLSADLDVYCALSGLVDLEKERVRLEKKRKEAKKELERYSKKLSNEGFLGKAAPEVVEKTRAQLDEAKAQIEAIEGELASLG